MGGAINYKKAAITCSLIVILLQSLYNYPHLIYRCLIKCFRLILVAIFVRRFIYLLPNIKLTSSWYDILFEVDDLSGRGILPDNVNSGIIREFSEEYYICLSLKSEPPI